MNVTEAVASRRSVRQFLDKPVDQAILERVLAKAQRAPSGGNTQPWNAVVLTGAPLADLTRLLGTTAEAAVEAHFDGEQRGGGFGRQAFAAVGQLLAQ